MDTVQAPGGAQPVGHAGTRVDIGQRSALAVSGWLGVLVIAGCVWWIVVAAPHGSGWLWLPLVVGVLVATALEIVAPGKTAVVQFFGLYVGTVTRPGFWWVLPLTVRRRVSIRVRNFETDHLKVNDADGNPVEIAAIVVWQVADTAKATYAVDDYRDFVSVQAESALRHVATSHPYDDATEDGTSLRGSTDLVAAALAGEVAARVSIAGVEIVEVRISHLAYAPRRCCAASRPTPWSRPARGSSKARSAWSNSRWNGWPSTTWSTWTRNARPAWSATSW